MTCRSISGRGDEHMAKTVASFVKIYELLAMTSTIRGNIMNVGRGQVSMTGCENLQTLLHFRWG